MRDPIYVVDPKTKATVEVAPTSFSQLNLRERSDLQEWLIARPSVLGEPLLLITSEFDRFDRSDRRLDLLLLDQRGTLVIVELKLDATGTLADQQAVRYAAFCSTMTMEEVVDLRAGTAGESIEQAIRSIQQFLGADSLPELSSEPRIILAAGAFEDQELTATVLWLRKFGLDISCVELTPYRYPGDDSNVLLVPKVLIPLPEALDYQIRLERKVRSDLERTAWNEFARFFDLVLQKYAELSPEVPGPSAPSTKSFMSVFIGHSQIHYEWLWRKREKAIDVALHFEAPDQETNLTRLKIVLDAHPNLASSFGEKFSFGAWGDRWAHLSVSIPMTGGKPGEDVAMAAASTMCKLISLTVGTVRTLS